MSAQRVAFLLLLLLWPTLAAAQAPDFTGVDEAANALVTSGEIPGVVVLIGRGDEVLLHRAYGSRRLVPEPAPMMLTTIFDIASLTKPFGTTLAVMSLVERGAIKLDAPLGRYLREFRGRRFEGATISRILTHSAGFAALPPNRAVAPRFPEAAWALARVPLEYPPGTGFQYSDTGFILLGEVVRRVSGERLDRYLERVFFRPLDLRDTSFRPRDAVKSRVAPTDYASGHLLQGEANDARARLLGGVAGHAGMFSTAADLARLCRMLLNGGTLDGRQYLKSETVALMWEPNPDGQATRTLGWDLSSPFSRTLGPFFPMGSVGHTGFTGTAVWLDPASRTYMIVLTNRVHPNGGGVEGIRELRLRIAGAVGAALFAGAPPQPAMTGVDAPAADLPAETPAPLPVSGATPGRVRTGLDVVASQNFATFMGHSVGLVTNQTGVDVQGRRAIDLFAAAPGVRLRAIFSPEHGIAGEAITDVPNGRDVWTKRPIWSLYGSTRRPTREMLRGVSLLVFDMQDVGVRHYTYLTTLVYVMEEAARAGIPLVVLDRPNPITGSVVEGPLMDRDLQSFTGPHTVPIRIGLTIGEFARMVAAERKIPVALTVIPMAGWERRLWYDETGLPWVNPSPNIRSLTEALLYSGIGLLEAANLSVGRGTDTPFEVVGAPWIEPEGLVDALNRLELRGVRFEPVWFAPMADQYAQVQCGGVRLVVTDRNAIRPVTVALALARELRVRHRDEFRPENIQNLLVNRPTMWAFLSGQSLDRLLTWADADRSSFLNRRASYLMYR